MYWISTKDKMPELDTMVLVYTYESQNSQIGEVNICRSVELGYYIDTTKKKGNVWQIEDEEQDFEDSNKNRHVTHWCSIPNPPDSV